MERHRLAESRMNALQTRLGLDIDTGRHHEAVGELLTLTTAHPLREALSGLLMLALQRCGRRAEALAVYEDTRRRLADELGVEPGAALRDIHARVEASPPEAPAVPGAGADAGPRPDTRPAQLPTALPDFTGCAEETERLVAALSARAAQAPVGVLSGMGGVGKTTLAVHVAHAVKHHYPDGQLYVDLRGLDERPADPVVVLARFLCALGHGEQGLPDGLEERVSLYRSALSSRRVLVVLDNARDAGQVRPLLPVTAGCAALVTSRTGLSELPDAAHVRLNALDTVRAAELFTRIAGRPGMDPAQRAVREVAECCAGLPLALRVVACRLAVRPDWEIDDVLVGLRDERRRLSGLSIEDLAVDTCFRVGYRHLDAAQARALRLLAQPTPRVLDLREAAAVIDVPERRTAELLESLADTGLLETPGPGRYGLHDLVRLFAWDQAAHEETPRSCHEALLRLLDVLTATALHAYRQLRPGHTVPAALGPFRYQGTPLSDEAEACEWGARSLGGVLETVRQTARTAPGESAALLLVLDPLLMADHRWQEAVQPATEVFEAAVQAGDGHAAARAGYILGGALMQQGDVDGAREVVDRALETTREGTADTLYAMLLHVDAQVRLYTGAAREAVDTMREAARHARDAGNRSLEAMSLGNVVQVSLGLDTRGETLLADARHQMRLHEELGDDHGRVLALYRLGQVLRACGQPDEALRVYRECLGHLGGHGRRLLRTGVLIRAAEAYLDLGDHRGAAGHAEQGLALAKEIGHGRLEAVAGRVLGDALAAMGHGAWAVTHWEAALATSLRLGVAGEEKQLRRRLWSSVAAG
jgi:tetratricopeptide (TPR) repeat protein